MAWHRHENPTTKLLTEGPTQLVEAVRPRTTLLCAAHDHFRQHRSRVGQQPHLSVRTVESHPYRAPAKGGVIGRAGLSSLLADYGSSAACVRGVILVGPSDRAGRASWL